ncbi:KOW domain-containing RNA-binding protein [Paludicola sp. MB14-C6]|uniref:KOW domain-containing RNA-binding protein n=1 Tax=Paludihabitans sp. MB14-C6 TaxID=3070656 RepID=UPI0027DB6EAC|nr:KOW domain-containing RNA-binding protein [Paludicola sp. MB14-C6]WMJ24161.1 KOW domain-containing RNA-binding protein [Paludicola sp. MB14-C6]
MQFQTGMIVRSNSGHDQNRFYVLVKLENNFGYIADGKRRKLENPKKKNLLHMSKTTKIVDLEQIDTDLKLRRVLWDYNYGNQAISVAE